MSDYKIVSFITKEIFRAYDIRGIVDETFTDDNIYTIGLALGSEVLSSGQSKIIVGRDGRLSGPRLSKALITGILLSGCDVINIGEVTTPILYYAAAIDESHTGVMLSGSHNPPNYNGIKTVINGNTLYGNSIEKIYQRIINQDFTFGQGEISNSSMIDSYIQRVITDVHLDRPLKIVIDCGNGAGGIVAPKLFRELGCDVVELYCKVDGSFPNHQPDPSVPKNLEDLVRVVKEQKADVGLAFDGDADRVGIVTESGEMIAADRLLMLFAMDILSKNVGETVVFDVKCTSNLADQIAKCGGVPLMYKTGHSLIKAKMKELGAPLAGELSGHIFIKERWYGFDDGVYVGARFLELLSKSDKKCSEIFSDLPDTVNTPEIKVPVEESKKFSIMENIINGSEFIGGRVNTIDGIRVDYDYGFGLVRISNTSPYLTMRFEGDTEESLRKVKSIFKEQLLKIEPTLELPL